MAFTLYRWDDASAPVLTGLMGSFIAVLKGCLVDGYGAKSAAGWSITMSDGPPIYNAVFRNNTAGGGFGSYFSVLDDGSSTVSGGVSARLRMWEAVTAYDTGTNGCTYKFVRKSGSAASTARPWVIIADDRFCYMFVWYANTTVDVYDATASLYWFGDGVPFLGADVYFSLLAGATATNTNPSTNAVASPPSTTSSYQHAQRSISQAGSFISPLVMCGSPSLSTFGSTTFGYSTFPFMGKKILLRPWVNDASAYSIRGWLPGLFVPFHYSTLFNNFSSPIINGVTYYAMKVNSGSVVLFDMANPRS